MAGSDTGYDTGYSSGYGSAPDPFGYGNPYAGQNPSNPTYGISPYIASNESMGLPPANAGYTAPSVAYGGGGYTQAGPALPLPTDPATDDAAKVWGFQQALAQQRVLGGFQDTQNQIQREGMTNQIGLLNAQEQQESGYLNQDYDLGNRRLDLKTKGIDIEKAANLRQPGFLTHLHDIAGRGFDLSRQENLARNRQGNFALFNESVGKGNVLLGGYNTQRGELAQQLMRGQVGVNLNQEEETAKYQEAMAKTADTNKRLDLDAQNVGLDREQLRNELQKGLERLHLSTSMSVDDLYTKIMSSNLDDAIQARQRWNDAWAASDAWKSLYPGQNVAEGYGGSSPSERTYGGGGARFR